MAKQTFTTGQVLTAAQMTSLQQTAMLGGAASAKTASYTLVAADAGTAISMDSASATTITVNTALFAAGDTVQITNLGAGVCTITAGTATVNSSASLALAQYESGTLDFTSTSAAIFIKGAGAAAASGGITLISTTSLTGTSVTISSIPQTYNYLYILINNFYSNTANRKLVIKPNGTSSIANAVYSFYTGGGTGTDGYNGGDLTSIQVSEATGALRNINAFNIYNYTDTVAGKPFTWNGTMPDNSAIFNYGGTFTTASAITSLVFTLNGAGNFDGGSIKLYGVK